VILGLVALVAVVGWRSRTRMGAYLCSQMVWLMAATAVLGRIVPIIDNWGHAGGALIGAAIGFAHRTLIRTPRRPVAKWAGGVGMLLLIASGAAQLRADRIEAGERSLQATEHQTIQILQETGGFYKLATDRSRFAHMTVIPEALRHAAPLPRRKTAAPARASQALSLWDSSDAEFRAELKRRLDRFDALNGQLGTGPAVSDYQRARTLLARVLDQTPTDPTVQEFFAHLNALVNRARRNQGSARATDGPRRQRNSHSG
jgi:hypothetical protein